MLVIEWLVDANMAGEGMLAQNKTEVQRAFYTVCNITGVNTLTASRA